MGEHPEHDEPVEIYRQRRELGRRLGERGWLYPLGARQYGGGGLTLDATLVLIEEMQRIGLSLPPYYDSGGVIGSVAIQVWGTEEQKQAFLPKIYSGEQRTWQLLTEPGAGSDAGGRRRLRRSGTATGIASPARRSSSEVPMAPTPSGPWCAPATRPPATRT